MARRYLELLHQGEEFQRGHASYMVEALERPLLLPKDMDALKLMR